MTGRSAIVNRLDRLFTRLVRIGGRLLGRPDEELLHDLTGRSKGGPAGSVDSTAYVKHLEDPDAGLYWIDQAEASGVKPLDLTQELQDLRARRVPDPGPQIGVCGAWPSSPCHSTARRARSRSNRFITGAVVAPCSTIDIATTSPTNAQSSCA